MLLMLFNAVAVVVVGFLMLRRGRDPRAGCTRSARWLRVAGLIPLALQIGIYLLFGIGEMASGDLSGAGHLLPAAVAALLAVLAWLRPLQGGIALLAAAALYAIVFAGGAFASGPPPPGAAFSPALLITTVPQLLSGILFTIAGMLSRRSSAGADQNR
jgi:hypothetical protein